MEMFAWMKGLELFFALLAISKVGFGRKNLQYNIP